MLTTASSPFLQDGFQFLKGVFTESELKAARYGQDEFMAGRADCAPAFDWPAPRARQCRSWKSPYSTHFRSELAALSRSPRLLAMIAEATEADELRLWFDQLLWEAPVSRPRPVDYHWHTERSRWKTCRARLMVTAWVPLDVIVPRMGPITMARESASRRWIELPDGWTPESQAIEPAPVQPGDAALFCWHTVHGNPPNFGSTPRRAIALHYAVDELAYRTKGKFSHLNERLVTQLDSGPDFTDQRVIPLIWQRDAACS